MEAEAKRRVVLVLGATGMIGREVVAELERRGHQVVRGRRPGSTADPAAASRFIEVDPLESDSVARAARSVDAVISALGGGKRGYPGLVRDVAPPLLHGLERAGTRRLLVVGGAGSLIDSDGERRVDAADFPALAKQGSLAQADALAIYRSYQGPVEWSYLSPSDEIGPGERTGEVELGHDRLLRGPSGESWVSLGDYAAALVDELESPQHTGRRFTVRTTTRPAPAERS